MNGAELVGLKESIEKNKQTKENMLKMTGFMSEKDRQNLTDKLDKEEADKKERIKEKEEKIADETKIFREPLEGRLKETSEIQNNLSEAFDFIKAGEVGLNKNIKECEAFIKEAQKLNLSDEVRADIVKNAEAQKAELDARAKEFAERKIIISSRLEVLKTNKKEIETTLGRINNIGKTKKEIEQEKKEFKEKEKDEEVKTEKKPVEEKKKDGEKKDTLEETRDEKWGVNNTQKTAPSDKKGGKKIDIGELFEHYGDVSEEKEYAGGGEGKESQKKEKSKADKKKQSNIEEMQSQLDQTESTIKGFSKKETEEIERVVLNHLKTRGFENIESEREKKFVMKWSVHGVKGILAKSERQDLVKENDIKDAISEYIKIGGDNRNEKNVLAWRYWGKKDKSEPKIDSMEDEKEKGEKEKNESSKDKIFTEKEIEDIVTTHLKIMGMSKIKDKKIQEQITKNAIVNVKKMVTKAEKPITEIDIRKETKRVFDSLSAYLKKNK